MALNINGYNTDFNAFVKFAQNSFVTNDKTAVARFEVRDEEAAQFSRFGGNGPGFMSV